MAQNASAPAPSKFFTLASVCIVVAALFMAREVLLPIALAVLLSFLLAPPVRRLERLHIPRVPAVLSVVLFSFVLLCALGWLISSQTSDLAHKLGEYKGDVESKIKNLRSGLGHGAFAKGIQEASNVVREVATSQPSATNGIDQKADRGTPDNPVSVSITGSQSTPESALSTVGSALALIFNALGSALSIVLPLAESLVVIVFVIFMLIQKEDLRDRLIRLVGHSQLTVTTQALDEAGTRVSQYLLAQSLLNASYGIIMGFGLFLLHIPNAPLWGLLCALLRFIPYLGIWIAALFPIILSFVVPEGHFAGRPFLTIGLFVVLELFTANFAEPSFIGSRTGVSPLAILFAAVFWTWLWGPVGLLLSTPITVVLAVMGKHVPQMRFLDILLSDQPVLRPFERYYQRLLADDAEEAEDLLEEFEKSRTLLDTYVEILLPALQYSERDFRRGLLNEERRQFIRKIIREHVEFRAHETSMTQDNRIDSKFAMPKDTLVNVVCLPAHDEPDEIAAEMLAHVLRTLGYSASALTNAALASEMVDAVTEKKADIVIISALPPGARAHARYLCKRLVNKRPDLRLLAGLWNALEAGKAKHSFYYGPSVRVTTSFADALPIIQQMVQPALMREKDMTKSTN